MRPSFFAGLTALSAAAFFADASAAKAALEFKIYESLGDLVVETSGSLNLPASSGSGNCGAPGAIAPTIGFMCTGPDTTFPVYTITGPSSYTGTADLYPGTSVSGISAGIVAGIGRLVMDSQYTSGSPIVSGAVFAGKTLADLGLTTSSGVLGTWTLNGTSETITIRVTTQNTNPVPGPLPLLGAGAAFGLSRRLRHRINA